MALHLIEIFRAGRHVSANGEAISFSEKDVHELASSYDPKLHKAPLVVGHPKDNSPSFGRAVSLGVVGTKLLASCDEIHADFREAVNAKRYPKVSASIYKRESPNNPTPGKLYLRHIGFLGGMPPAVKGLEDASFAGNADDFVTFEFAESDAAKPNAPAAPDTSGAQPGEADKPKPPPPAANPALDAFLKALNVDDATRAKLAEVIEPILTAAKPKEEPVDHAERRQKLEAGERELAKRQATQRRHENKAFLGELRGKGIVIPVRESLALSFMDLLASTPRDAVNFGENETRTPDQIFREDFLAKMKPTVDFRELSQLADDEEADGSDAFSLSEAASEYMREQAAKGRKVHSAEAVAHVQRQRKR